MTAVNLLFAMPRGGKEVSALMAYPWRAVWRINPERAAGCPQFLVTVPKKRLRHAVDRVRMRRLCREAYRLSRDLMPADLKADIAFIYVADRLTDYAHTLKAVRKILGTVGRSAHKPAPEADESV